MVTFTAASVCNEWYSDTAWTSQPPSATVRPQPTVICELFRCVVDGTVGAVGSTGGANTTTVLE
jgi:hypothetical protein